MKTLFAPAQPPTHRPVWLVVLSLLMLLHGGVWLVGALTNLRDPRLLATLSVGDTTETPEELELHHKIVNVTQGILLGHHAEIRAVTLVAVVLALFMLYAVAAILSRDKNGRSLALASAWLIVLYQLGSLPIFLRIARDHVSQSAPLFAQILSRGQDGADRAAVLRKLTSVIMVEPYLMSACGIGWALLLIAYFGGRRGRTLYGVASAQS